MTRDRALAIIALLGAADAGGYSPLEALSDANNGIDLLAVQAELKALRDEALKVCPEFEGSV